MHRLSGGTGPGLSSAGRSRRSCLLATRAAHQGQASTRVTMSGLEAFGDVMPKKEIGALDFVTSNPTYDGRGAIIAIFDTGVDPAASGLATTPDGRPKIVDLVDGTGSGDVAMGPKIKAVDGVLTGLYDKELKINPSWTNPSGEWRVGAKPLFQIYPPGCKVRMKEKRKEKWQVEQNKSLSAAVTAQRDAAEALKAAQASPSSSDAGKDASPTLTDLKEALEDAKARVKLLEEHADKYDDVGPMLHCVVWHDGDVWRAAVDSSDLHEAGSEEGRLADCPAMTNFRLERQYSTFSHQDACNFAVNIYDDGATLSVVVDTGSHGTHVAGIAAAYHPDEPRYNGVAPGAQIVSCKIGDTRADGMETGPGLTRAMAAVLENGADVINMSYGEPTMTPNTGRFVELANELVHDKGVIFVSSAGNSGPGLTTSGAPGATSTSIWSIGAYMSAGLARTAHSQHLTTQPDTWTGEQYNFSSRGPTADGDVGVEFSAPGGAIAPVPQWSEAKRTLMKGTSMASPNAAGGVALLVSALKQLKLPVQEPQMRRAIRNTALRVHEGPVETLKYGAGVLQVGAALDYITANAAHDTGGLRYDVSVVQPDGGRARGVFLREPSQLCHSSSHPVRVRPRLHRDADIRQEKLEVEEEIALVSTAPEWLSVPERLMLHHSMREFNATVNPVGLQPGVHYAEVEFRDAEERGRGVLERVPVTVCVPQKLQQVSAEDEDGRPFDAPRMHYSFEPMHFIPGRQHRVFLHPPLGAGWAEVVVKIPPHATPKIFSMHATQLLPHMRPIQSRYAMESPAGALTRTFAFPVTGGAALEVVFVLSQVSDGEARLEATLEFHGLEVSTRTLRLGVPQVVGSFAVHVPLRRTIVSPSCTLKTLNIPLMPSDSQLTTLDTARDALFNGRVMQRMMLTYKLTLAEGGAITPVVVPLEGAVYDGLLEGQLYSVYNKDKRLLSFGDVYPSSVTVPKGDYTIQVVLRHDSVKVLESMKEMPLRVERALESGVSVPFYRSLAKALEQSKAAEVKDVALLRNGRLRLFAGPVDASGLPKDAVPGCTLVGTAKVAKTSAVAGSKAAPTEIQVVYEVGAKASASSGDSGDADADEDKNPETVMNEARRDADVKILKALKRKPEAAAAVYATLQTELKQRWPKHLPVFVEGLDRSAKEYDDDKEEGAERLKAAAEEVLNLIDTTEIAHFIASKAAAETPAEKKQQKAMKEARDAMFSALHHKCRACLTRLEAAEAAAGATEAAPAGNVGQLAEEFEEAYKSLRRWVDVGAADYVVLYAARERRKGRFANAIKGIDKIVNDKDKVPSKEMLELKAKLLQDLGWMHWVKQQREHILQAFPSGYQPF